MPKTKDLRLNYKNRYLNILDELKNSPVTYKHICTQGIKSGKKKDCSLCNVP